MNAPAINLPAVALCSLFLAVLAAGCGGAGVSGLPGQAGPLQLKTPLESPGPFPSGPDSTPTVTAYTIPTTNSGLNGIMSGLGYIWFTESNSGKIGRLTTSGAFTEYPGAVHPYGLAVGPDNNLWFVNNGAGPTGCDLLGKFTVATGIITSYSLPPFGYGHCLSIPKAGPDGNIWVPINSDATTVASVDVVQVDGTVVASYPLPSNTYPIGNDVFGPDGNFWVGEPAINKIAKMTLSGAATEYSLSGGTVWVTNGPDGNIWVTQGDNNIGRITPAGVVTEFPVTTPSSGLLGIASGSDGNLWFVEGTANQIGRITPSGKVTEFRLLTPSSGASIMTAGPDGDVWFTQGASNDVAKFKP